MKAPLARLGIFPQNGYIAHNENENTFKVNGLYLSKVVFIALKSFARQDCFMVTNSDMKIIALNIFCVYHT